MNTPLAVFFDKLNLIIKVWILTAEASCIREGCEHLCKSNVQMSFGGFLRLPFDRDHICHKHHKQRLCKIFVTRVKVHFVDVF